MLNHVSNIVRFPSLDFIAANNRRALSQAVKPPSITNSAALTYALSSDTR